MTATTLRQRHTAPTISSDKTKTHRLCVVGGGPAGALCAKALAERGFSVTLYEAYPHPSETLRGNKAYTIVLSTRGQRALNHVGISERDVTGGILSPVVARHTPRKIRVMRHDDAPSLVVSRKSLAAYLLDEASKAGATVKLEHRLVDIDFEAKAATFEKVDGTRVRETYDLLLGCDGKDDTTEYQVAILEKTFKDIARNQDDASCPPEAVHSWNDRSANSLCLAFPHEEGGLLFAVIFPGGKLAEFKANNSYEAALSSLLHDISEETRSEIIEQLKEGRPSIGGTCVWSSYLGSAAHGVALVGDSGHGMYPSLGQGANCALESAAAFVQAADCMANRPQATWAQCVVKEFNDQRYEDAMAAVDLTYGGMGGNKSRHQKNAPVLYMAQLATMFLLNKLSLGVVPKPALMRLFLGDTSSYSKLKRYNDRYEKMVLAAVVVLPLALYLGLKFKPK